MGEYHSSDFYENEDQALRPKQIVLRDSLGMLAVEILNAREDISTMKYSDMLDKLYEIIDDLHKEYHHRGSSTELC